MHSTHSTAITHCLDPHSAAGVEKAVGGRSHVFPRHYYSAIPSYTFNASGLGACREATESHLRMLEQTIECSGPVMRVVTEDRESACALTVPMRYNAAMIDAPQSSRSVKRIQESTMNCKQKVGYRVLRRHEPSRTQPVLLVIVPNVNLVSSSRIIEELHVLTPTS